jgi:hypothetical protein
VADAVGEAQHVVALTTSRAAVRRKRNRRWRRLLRAPSGSASGQSCSATRERGAGPSSTSIASSAASRRCSGVTSAIAPGEARRAEQADAQLGVAPSAFAPAASVAARAGTGSPDIGGLMDPARSAPAGRTAQGRSTRNDRCSAGAGNRCGAGRSADADRGLGFDSGDGSSTMPRSPATIALVMFLADRPRRSDIEHRSREAAAVQARAQSARFQTSKRGASMNDLFSSRRPLRAGDRRLARYRPHDRGRLPGPGARVYISARKAEACDQTAAELSSLGTCVSLPADFSTPEGVKDLVDAFARHEPALDILVNNAGAAWGESFDTFPRRAGTRSST